MTEISDLEHRINTALERIGAAVEGVTAPRPESENAEAAQELEELRTALEDEKTANTQLEERMRQLRERQDDGLKQLEERVQSLGARAADQEREVARLAALNDQLRSASEKLREAALNGAPGPEPVNATVLAELESLQILYDSQKQELDALLAELRPVVEAVAEGA